LFGKLKTLHKILFIAILTFAVLNLSCKETKEGNDIRQLWIECNLNEDIPFEVFNTAVLGYRQIENIKKKNLLTIIDYSRPSTEKRFFVIDLEKKQL
jgi:hypothetical protein